jgi:hypothetical protein
LIFKTLMYPLNRRKLNKASEAGKLYQVFVEKDAEFKPSQYNNFFDSMYTIYNPRHSHKWISMEFHGSSSGIRLYSWLSGGIAKDFIQSNINSIHPAAEVVDVKSDYAAYGRLYGKEAACATLELEGHYLFNLAQSDGERVGADLMASLCASMDNLDDDEEVSVQFLLRPVNYKMIKIAESHFELYKRFGKRPSRLHYPWAQYNPYLEVPKALFGAVRHATMGSAGAREQHQNVNSIQKKMEAGVYFDLMVRVVCSHKKPIKAHNRLTTVLSAFAPATDKNRLRPYTDYKNRYLRLKGMTIFRSESREKFLKDFEARKIHTYPVENYLTPAELATLLHYPSKDIKGVIRLRAKKLPVPEGVFTYNSIEEAWKDKAIVFGRSNFRGRLKFLAFKDIKMLLQHLYCIGGTGSGKSYWLSLIALQVQKCAGVTFFDVKGDVVDDFMRHLPKSEWKRIVYIDLQDDMRFLPFNILRCRVKDVYDLATMIVDVFVKVFSDGSIKEHSQNVLRQALIAVISSDKEGSILEVYRMFTDEAYLDDILRKMDTKTEFPDVLAYWKGYKKLKASARRSECSAILNKLMLITQNKRPRYTLCQKNNVIDWRTLMDEKAIVLVNFSMGQNKDQILEFFGTMFTTFISDATFSRDDTHRDDRVPHFFIVDEFEMFIHQDRDMRKFLEMARSYGLGLGLAHQNVAQITQPALLGTIRDNTFSQVSLLIGDKSAPSVSDMFPGVVSEDLTTMEEHTGFGRFKKLSPAAFTFDCPNMTEIFPSVSWEEVAAWKESYKKKHYKHLAEVKDNIDQRYALVESNQIQDDDSPRVQKGNASGRLKRKGGSDGRSEKTVAFPENK